MPVKLKLSDWKVFEVAGESGSLRRASKILNLDAANVKRAIDKLEKSIKKKLFIRSPSGLILTCEGLEYLKRVKEQTRFLDLTKRFSKQISLSVTVDPRLNLLLALEITSQLKFTYPHLSFSLSHSNPSSGNAQDWIKIELKESNEIDAKRRLIVAAPRFITNNNKPYTFKDLSKLAYIAVKKDLESQMHFSLTPAITLNSNHEAIEAAKLGLGFCLSFMNSKIRREVSAGSLICIAVELPEPTWKIRVTGSKPEYAELFDGNNNSFAETI